MKIQLDQKLEQNENKKAKQKMQCTDVQYKN